MMWRDDEGKEPYDPFKKLHDEQRKLDIATARTWDLGRPRKDKGMKRKGG